eukprot:3257367-Rhodomonas_salina.2
MEKEKVGMKVSCSAFDTIVVELEDEFNRHEVRPVMLLLSDLPWRSGLMQSLVNLVRKPVPAADENLKLDIRAISNTALINQLRVIENKFCKKKSASPVLFGWELISRPFQTGVRGRFAEDEDNA